MKKNEIQIIPLSLQYISSTCSFLFLQTSLIPSPPNSQTKLKRK